MDWIIYNNKYVVIQTIVKNEEIETNIRLFKLEKEAKKFLIQEKDVLMSKLIEKYDPENFNNFEIDEFGVLKTSNNYFEFIDFEGEIQIKYEIKNVREM